VLVLLCCPGRQLLLLVLVVERLSAAMQTAQGHQLASLQLCQGLVGVTII
jgi:hypothetical protein